MKELKSSIKDLRELFERSITVKDIAEPLASFDVNCPAPFVRQFMDKKKYDVIGVRRDGLVVGYARKNDLSNKELCKHLVKFDQDEILPDTEPLINVFKLLHRFSRVFVLVLGEVGGIVTRGDLQKAPIRMWLFGLVSLIEMHLLRIIRHYYNDEGWKELLTKERLTNAQKTLDSMKLRNEDIDLAGCLQLCDKCTIVSKNAKLRISLGFDSKKSAERFFKDLEKLRNNLAHAQDIITSFKGKWSEVVDLAEGTERLLQRCEVI